MPKDPDYNRQMQSTLAQSAYTQGKYYAQRHIAAYSCDRCKWADHEWLDINDVIYMRSDHKYGHCFFTFHEFRGGGNR